MFTSIKLSKNIVLRPPTTPHLPVCPGRLSTPRLGTRVLTWPVALPDNQAGQGKGSKPRLQPVSQAQKLGSPLQGVIVTASPGEPANIYPEKLKVTSSLKGGFVLSLHTLCMNEQAAER